MESIKICHFKTFRVECFGILVKMSVLLSLNNMFNNM